MRDAGVSEGRRVGLLHEADVLDDARSELISIVIPTLNESAYIGRCLSSIESQRGPLEIVVCDGGSTDETIDIARCRARIVSTSSGRAHQMNTGAHNATGEILVFLHADTALPDGGLESIREAFKSPRVAGGCFRLCFDEENVLLRFYSWGTSVVRWSRLVFGDRTIFVRRGVFEQVGGFPDQPLFEDMEFFRAVRETGPVAYLSSGVITSSRRFSQHGYFHQQLRNLGLWLLYLLGVPAGRLRRFYPNANAPQMRKQRPT